MPTNYVEVTGTGAATQAPDRIDLSLSVTAVRPGVAEALAHVDQQVAALASALRGVGVPGNDLQTTSSTVHEEYGGPESTRVGYRAGQDLTVRVADLEALPVVLGAAVDAVGDDLRMNGLGWAVADETTLVRRARAAAYEDARAKADELAGLSGRAVGKLLRITEGAAGNGAIPRLAVAKSDTAGFAPEPGSARVEVSLVTRWSLT